MIRYFSFLRYLFLPLLFLSLFYAWLLSWFYHLKGLPNTISDKELAFSPKGKIQFITRTDGTTLRVMSGGTGPMVVLAHGNAGSVNDWNLIIPQLVKNGYSYIAFDQRGHNESTIGELGLGSFQMASDYATILSRFDVKDAVLVGHSMGGFMAIRFLLLYPHIAAKRLKSAFIISSFAGELTQKSYQNQLQIALLKSGVLRNIARFKPMGYLISKSLLGKRPSPSILEANLKGFINFKDRAKIAPLLKVYAEESYYDQLHQIDLPCSLMVGEADGITPPSYTLRMAKNLQSAKVQQIPDAGHLLPWESPEFILKEIDWLHKNVEKNTQFHFCQTNDG